ncbi:DUF4139 domain-containing protein [Sphingomonas oligophenolica]|uniref:DUF4139 domain-containing protein n=1 Tax=Sphingomonas oligophenolica TaxID=301154 RepID=A0ABU9Y5E3_9SPHN
MRVWITMALAVLPVSATAQTQLPNRQGGNAQGDVAITIYSNDVALIQDTRQLTLPAGVSRQDFPDVSSNIRPATVRLSAAGTEIVEQNYDYDLLSPTALMEKAVGQNVTLIRTNPATGVETREVAKVLASNDGVVLQIGNRIEVLREDGLPVRVVFDSLPPNLRARPTLSVTLDTRAAGPRPVTLSYLASGFSWSADYVALFDEAKSVIDVQGWVTLQNNSGTSFPDADTLLVAGNPGANGNRNTGYAPGRNPGTETAARARLGDYYLYPIKNRTTLAANQQKQVSFLNVSSVPARKAYEFRNAWLNAPSDPQSAATVLEFSSSKEGGLGDALPAGTVRVYIRDAKGQPQFIGENSIGHTPMGSSLALKTGEAFDVKVKPVVESRTRQGSSRWRSAMRYSFTNARPEAVTVDLVQAGLDSGYDDTRIIDESQPSERRSSNEAVWHVSVPANGEATLTATFETRY